MNLLKIFNRIKTPKPVLKTIGYKIYLKEGEVYDTYNKNVTEDKVKEMEEFYKKQIDGFYPIIENAIKNGQSIVNLSGFVFKIDNFNYMSTYSTTQK